MTASLENKTVAFLVANEGVEQVELTEPWKAVEEAGGTPVLLAPEQSPVQAYNHLDKGDTFDPAGTIGDARPDEYDAVMLPGGVANPDQLRTRPEAISFVQELAARGKPIAVICHGPWTLVEAGLVSGRTITSWPSLKTDITNAGGQWVDEEVVVDNGVVSSRKPDDLPAFCEKMIDLFAAAPVGG